MQEIRISGVPSSVAEKDEAKMAMDIFESDNFFVIVVPLAGISLKDMKIQLSDDVLSISGERKFPTALDEFARRKYFLEECYWGRFSRSVVLPSVVSSADIRAKAEDGVLYITMPKARKAGEKEVLIERNFL